MSTDALAHALRQLADHHSLTEDETAAAFDVIMRGDATASQVGAMLMGLRVKGETPDEIAGAARALHRRSPPTFRPSRATPSTSRQLVTASRRRA